MHEAHIAVKIGFCEALIMRIKNRNIVPTPSGTAFRNIDVDTQEIEKLQETLYNLRSIVQEMIDAGYDDVHNFMGDIHSTINDLEEYVGCNAQ